MLPQEIKHSKIASEAKNTCKIFDEENSFSFFFFFFIFWRKQWVQNSLANINCTLGIR